MHTWTNYIYSKSVMYNDYYFKKTNIWPIHPIQSHTPNSELEKVSHFSFILFQLHLASSHNRAGLAKEAVEAFSAHALPESS